MENNRALNQFLNECSDNLELFESKIFDFENDPQNTSTINSLFRAIHTIKGSSGFFPFPKVEQLTHKLESILSSIREGKVLQVNEKMISTFFQVADSIKSLCLSIQEHGHESQACIEESLLALSELSNEFNLHEQKKENAPREGKKKILNPQQIKALQALGSAGEEVLRRSLELTKTQGSETNESSLNSAAEKQPTTQITKNISDSVRVNSSVLQKLNNLVADLILLRNSVFSELEHSEVANPHMHQLDKLTNSLRDTMIETRMQPLSSISSRLSRVVRDAALNLNKKVKFIIEGENTQLDKSILELLADPLIHILRNSLDHGIEEVNERIQAGKNETGFIKLKAEYDGSFIYIFISDDGKGISVDTIKKKAIEKSILSKDDLNRMSDEDILNLVFEAGFSTKESVSKVSGRGVGMDVVRTNIRKLNGQVSIFSKEGHGTEIRVKLPLTLAISRAALININNHPFLVQEAVIQEFTQINTSEIYQTENQAPSITIRAETLTVCFARQFLTQLQGEQENVNIMNFYDKKKTLDSLIINSNGYKFVFVIDSVPDVQDIIVKPVHLEAKLSHFYAGSSILANDQVAVILNMESIAQHYNIKQSLEIKKQQLNKQQNTQPNLSISFQLTNGSNYLLAFASHMRIEEIEQKNIIHSAMGMFARVTDKGELIRIFDLENLLFADEEYNHNEQANFHTILYLDSLQSPIGIIIGHQQALHYKSYELQTDTNYSNSEYIEGITTIRGESYNVLNFNKLIEKLSKKNSHNLIKNQENNDSKKIKYNTIQTLSFKMNNILFGIKLSAIQEVINRKSISSIAGTGQIEGLINYRGNVINTLDLAKILNMEKEINDENILESIVINNQNTIFNLQVDNIRNIIKVKENSRVDHMDDIPATIHPYLDSVYKLKDDILFVLDENKLGIT